MYINLKKKTKRKKKDTERGRGWGRSENKKASTVNDNKIKKKARRDIPTYYIISLAVKTSAEKKKVLNRGNELKYEAAIYR